MSEPILQLEARDAVRVNGSWRVRWRVTNVGSEHVRLVAVRAPHSRFRADPVDLNVVVVESAGVEQTLRIEAAPGEEIENAFVIFVVVKEHETWRVGFPRRVLGGAGGQPRPLCESV